MKFTRILVTLLVVSSLFLACRNKSDQRKNDIMPISELRELDNAINRADEYYLATQRRLDSMERVATLQKNPINSALAYSRIANEMRVIRADSAIEIASKAMLKAAETENDSVKIVAKLSHICALASAGIFNQSEYEFFEVGKQSLTGDLRLEYWTVGRYLYSSMQLYTEENYDISKEFSRQAMAFDDSLMMYMDPKSPLRQFLIAERLVVNGDNQKARVNLEKLMKDVGPNSNIYGMAAYQMALVYKNTGNEKQYAAYMAKAAQANVQQSVREGLALFNLANWLYTKGELNKAFRYINFAMGQAIDANARMRTVNIASMLPLIDDAYRTENKNSHDKLLIYFAISSLLLVVLAVLLFLLIMQSKRSRENGRKLRALSQAQERHIANFLALCSTYYHKLNSLEQLVQRKIASGQTDQLVKLLKNNRYTEDGEDEIFEIFDRSFMEIYPDFIEQINLLLRPEERFESTPGKKGMHIELRIYALVKLGITESTRIAQILNYSVRTVYTYRNKMRNKAIDREHFEEQVQGFEVIEDI